MREFIIDATKPFTEHSIVNTIGEFSLAVTYVDNETFDEDSYFLEYRENRNVCRGNLKQRLESLKIVTQKKPNFFNSPFKNHQKK